jgi:hypothetical protein
MRRPYGRTWLWILVATLTVATLTAGCGGPPEASEPEGLRTSFPGRDPSLQREADGTVHVVYVDEQPGGPAVFYRRLGARAFGPVRVSPAGISVSAHGEAPPVLQILPGGSLTVAYAAALPGKWKNEIRLQRSNDGGAHWSAAEHLHPERIGAHSYLSATVTAAGEPVFAWLDDSTGQMGLHAKVGAAPPVTLDSEACQCCGTALLADRKGKVWLAYRDADDDIRDFRVLRTNGAGGFDQGRTLSADEWKIQGCPHTGARLAQTPDGALWATWFTAGAGQAGIYAAASTDDGETFSTRTLVAAAGPGKAVRHPELGALPDGGVVVLYESEGHGRRVLLAQTRDARTGVWQAPQRVASGGLYPRWALGGDRAALAFTCPTQNGSQVVVTDWAGVSEKGSKEDPKEGVAAFTCDGSSASHSGHT